MFTVVRIIAIIMLALAVVGGQAYDFYMILRVVVCVISAYSAYKINKLGGVVINQEFWLWSFVIVAALFNPIVPVHLGRGAWLVIDVATIVLFVYSLIRVRPPKSA